MKLKFASSLLLMLFVAVALWAAPPQGMTVAVVNAHIEPAQPVAGVRVALTYVDGSFVVTEARDVTNRLGEAWLLVSQEAQQRGGLSVEITGAAELVIYQPAGGVLPGVPEKIRIQLLPKGSAALKGPAQIEAMLYRYSQRIQKLQVAAAQAQQQKPDFARDLREWGAANGFGYDEVDKEVRQWASNIEKQKDQATLRQKMLAELAQRNYDAVIQLAGDGMDLYARKRAEREKAYLEDERRDLQEYLELANTQAKAFHLKLQYHQATAALEKARDQAASEHQRYADDKALRGIWLDAVEKAADAREQEGEYGLASESLALLTRSEEDYRGLLEEHASAEDRKDWARTQNDLGAALRAEGDRASGEKSMALIAASNCCSR
jgi:hypothetical protein